MIIDRPLTEAEKRRSRLCYTISNGFGSMGGCMLFGILLLAGVELGVGNKILSTFGSINYASYVAIPLGILVTRRLGAAASMLWGKVLITIMCVAIAACGLLPRFQGQLLFLAAMCVCYLANSASIALLWPVQRCITDHDNLPGFLSLNNIVIAVANVTCSLLIAWFLKKHTGFGAFSALFLVSGFFYVLNGVFFGLMAEPSELRQLASRPILPQVQSAWKAPSMGKLLAANFICNLAISIVLNVVTLAAKRGFNADNSCAMLLTLSQTLTVIIASCFFPRVVRILGFRGSLLWSIIPMAGFCLCWLAIPVNTGFLGLLLPFVLVGAISSFWAFAPEPLLHRHGEPR